MLSSVVKFTDDSAGLEKTLRLLQGFCTIAVGLAASAVDADYWAKTRGQFALGRRYFRLLKWYPCFVNASNAMRSAEKPLRRPILPFLDTMKWSFLSLYFFLEMFTISNAMGVTTFEWGPTVQHEANKCWIYSLATSILLSLVELIWFNVPVSETSPKVDGKEKSKGSKVVVDSAQTPLTKANSTIYMQLIVDCCDILLPGSAVGWCPAPLAAPLVVGIASTISTTLTGSQIWKRVQQNSR